MESMRPSKVVEHYQGSGTSDGSWIAKIAALLVGKDPSQSYALICGSCHMHNGMFITKCPPGNQKCSFIFFCLTCCTYRNWMHCMIRELAGLARKEDFPHVTYYCPHCHALNMSNQSIGQCSGSDSGQLSPVALLLMGFPLHILSRRLN